MNNLRPGDRVRITNSEFPTWRPTNATVVKIWIKFPGAEPPIRRQMISFQLDEHPFPEQLAPEPMRNLGFEIDDPNYTVERI